MIDDLMRLTRLSYDIGLIGLSEFFERRAVHRWLSDAGPGGLGPDPRGPSLHNEEEHRFEEENPESGAGRLPQGGLGSGNASQNDDEEPGDRWPTFMAFNKWVFTLGDPDCYPAVPHGHLHRKTNEWPKLNPYIGRAFSGVHLEEQSMRLTRREMKTLWNDAVFIDHCEKHIEWYAKTHKSYGFPNARYGRLVFPRW